MERALCHLRRQSQLRDWPPSGIFTAPFPVPGPQVSHKESEEALQKRLDEVSRELCRSQTSHASLRADAEKAQEQQQQMAGKGGLLAPSGPEGLCQMWSHTPPWPHCRAGAHKMTSPAGE